MLHNVDYARLEMRIYAEMLQAPDGDAAVPSMPVTGRTRVFSGTPMRNIPYFTWNKAESSSAGKENK